MNIQKIGVVHSPFNEVCGTPIQPTAAKDVKGTIEIFAPFVEGLVDLDGFSHIYVLFGFHCSEGYNLKVQPYLDNQLRGVFSTRAPKRPSQIGLSIVKLEKVVDGVLYLSGVDMLDGTPVYDIKPYLPMLNPQGEVRIGWAAKNHKNFNHQKADDRI